MLIKRKHTLPKSGPKIYKAFLTLGINIYRPYATSIAKRINNVRQPKFWLRDDLQYVLVDAKEAYRQQSFLSHPDRGGSQEEMTNLNLAWDFIQRAFKKKGYTLN